MSRRNRPRSRPQSKSKPRSRQRSKITKRSKSRPRSMKRPNVSYRKHRGGASIKDLTLLPYSKFPSHMRKINFRSKDFVIDTTRDSVCIGKDSRNGFIRRCYLKDYPLIIKMVRSEERGYTVDSLYYEYLVGKCINEFSNMYPFFSRTLAFGELKDYSTYKQLKSLCDSQENFKLPVGDIFYNYDDHHTDKDTSVLKFNTFKDTCKKFSKNPFAIFSQYIPIYKSYGDYIDTIVEYNFNKKKEEGVTQVFVINALISAMLYGLRDRFTHNDLHTNNIVLVKIPNDDYVCFRIHDDADTKSVLELHTRLIPVVIDYGRCYVRCDKLDTHDIYTSVCNSYPDDCGRECGYSTRYMRSYRDNEDPNFGLYDIIGVELPKINKHLLSIHADLVDTYNKVSYKYEDSRGERTGYNLTVDDLYHFYKTHLSTAEFAECMKANIAHEGKCVHTIDLYTDGKTPFKMHGVK